MSAKRTASDAFGDLQDLLHIKVEPRFWPDLPEDETELGVSAEPGVPIVKIEPALAFDSEIKSAPETETKRGIEVESRIEFVKTEPAPETATYRESAPPVGTIVPLTKWHSLAQNWKRAATAEAEKRAATAEAEKRAATAEAEKRTQQQPPRALGFDEVNSWVCEELAAGWGDRVQSGQRILVRYVARRANSGLITMSEDSPVPKRVNNTTVVHGQYMALQKTGLGGVTRSVFKPVLAYKKKAQGKKSFPAGIKEGENDELEVLQWITGLDPSETSREH
ncbi:hypothetical protein HDU87_000678 [Geranomyces variabilis]|uniref:Uncharacterized protein n=1 Tax=Geranomyces variabilis TaxID=109894 RepID=A0AAD5TN19_9FUNG|nr:hypothetical protein HDU87_000678 [Geranomyces variabilis]